MNTIGRRDKVDLPEFKLIDIEAKIDTGAYGCALHCHHIQLDQSGEAPVLTFKVLDASHPEAKDRVFSSSRFKTKKVKNSGGQSEDRFVITTSLTLFRETHEVEFSLTDRSSMKYPMLIGRKFLAGKFMVDVEQKDISYNLKYSKK